MTNNNANEKPLISQEEMEEILRKANFERVRRQTQQQLDNEMDALNNRARSVSVGTAFGGTIDLTMRRPDGVCTYAIIQPVEAIELIHSLAAAVGCHIHLQPRKDFSSWRIWKDILPETSNLLTGNVETNNTQTQLLSSHPPHPNFVFENRYKGREMPIPKEQPGLNPSTMSEEQKV